MIENSYNCWDNDGYFYPLRWYKITFKKCFFYFYVGFEENNFVISYSELDIENPEKPIDISNALIKAKNVKSISDIVLSEKMISFDEILDKKILDFLNFRMATDLCKTSPQ